MSIYEAWKVIVIWKVVSLSAVGRKDISGVFLVVPRICTVLLEIKKGVRKKKTKRKKL